MPTPKTTPATKPPPIPTPTPVHAHTETLGLSRFAMAHPIEKHSPAAVKPVARDGEEDIQAIPGVAASDLRAGLQKRMRVELELRTYLNLRA